MNAFFAIIHVLAGAIWLGSMFYSLFVLHPRARIYFNEETDFESFIATVSQGARWKVISAMGIIAVTGIALVLLRWPLPSSTQWGFLIVAKIALFIAAVCLFIYTSWHLWPTRVMALPDDIPRIQRKFTRIGRTMIVLAVLSMVLGILAHTL